MSDLEENPDHYFFPPGGVPINAAGEIDWTKWLSGADRACLRLFIKDEIYKQRHQITAETLAEMAAKGETKIVIDLTKGGFTLTVS